MTSKAWSLAAELHSIEFAVRAASTLAEEIEASHDDPKITARLATSIVAVLTLANLRMRDIGRVLHADNAAQAAPDIARLHNPHSAVDIDASAGMTVAHGGDIVFTPCIDTINQILGQRRRRRRSSATT